MFKIKHFVQVKVGPDVTLAPGKILMSTPPVDSFDDPIEGFSGEKTYWWIFKNYLQIARTYFKM